MATRLDASSVRFLGKEILSARFVPPPELLANLRLSKPVTRLAQDAIEDLNRASAAVLREAMTTVKNRNIEAMGLLDYLERKGKFNEILSRPADEWSEQTKNDIATAFQMQAGKTEVMDAIVSISILSNPDLEEEIRAENVTEASDSELLENRRVVWQHPEPGTPLDPPYVVLVAVEQYDGEEAERLIQSMLGDLVAHDGFRLPQSARAKLTGRFAVASDALKEVSRVAAQPMAVAMKSSGGATAGSGTTKSSGAVTAGSFSEKALAAVMAGPGFAKAGRASADKSKPWKTAAALAKKRGSFSS